MRISIALILLLGILSAAIYSIPKSAESLRWTSADGYDCEDTGTNSFTCCKNYSGVMGGVTISVNRCIDCNYTQHDPGVSCGSPYFSFKSVDTGDEVDPKAMDLIGKGLANLNDRTQKGGQVDPKDLNSAKALIGQGLTILTKGGTEKGTVDPKVTKDANDLIDRILSSDNALINGAQNTKIPETGGFNDGGGLNDTRVNNDTKKVPKDLGGPNNDNDGPGVNPGE